MRGIVLFLIALTTAVAIPRYGAAADFVSTAMSGMPTQTMRVEYSSPSALRKIPNYQGLRGKFLGPRLQQLEASLDQVGISEDAIDELMIGWKPGDKEMDLYGYASGHFNKTDIAHRAAAQSLTPTPIGDQTAYCLSAGVNGTCILVFDNTLGAFGPLTALSNLLDVHEGNAPSLNTEPQFTSLLADVDQSTPIWGIAVGGAVADWFGGWLSSQNTVKLDWGQVFGKVDSMVYTIDAADHVNLNLKLNCQTAQDAATLRQVLDGLKVAQQLTWANQNPGHPNPYTAMNVEVHDRQIGVQVAMNYSELTLAGGVGAPQ